MQAKPTTDKERDGHVENATFALRSELIYEANVHAILAVSAALQGIAEAIDRYGADAAAGLHRGSDGHD